MPRKDDRELVEASREGDLDAFGTLVQRYQKRIYRIALHLLRDAADAEDVTQEAFVHAFAALDRFDGRSQPFTWMYRIAVNLSLNAIRARRSRRRAGALDDPRIEELMANGPRAPEDPQTAAAERELAGTLCEAIDALTDTLRTTLVLIVVDGLSHAEAAEVLGCPEGTIAWRIHEARRKIRKHLDDRGFRTEDSTP
jgi:RNA polymerase sigma-70 factor (ECF subfamily)